MAKGKSRCQYLGQTGMVQGAGLHADWDFLYRHSTAKDPLYNIGDRTVMPDGRVFRYGFTTDAVGTMKMAMCTKNILVAMYDVAPICRPTAAIAVGDRSAAFTCTAGIGATDPRTGEIALDELRGGYISVYGSSTYRPQRGIIGNSAKEAADTSITLYFDAPFETAIDADVSTEIMANPYRNMGYSNATSGMSGWLGMPIVIAAADEYMWIQTWGIFRVSPIAGALGNQRPRQLCFASNGGVRTHDASVDQDAAGTEQHCGFVMESTVGEAAEAAAPFVNLQINS